MGNTDRNEEKNNKYESTKRHSGRKKKINWEKNKQDVSNRKDGISLMQNFINGTSERK